MALGARGRALASVLFVLGVNACGDGPIRDNSLTQPTPESCSYSLSVSTFTFAASGGTGSVTVSAGQTCAWTATTDAPWIAITSSSSGTGAGSVAFSVAAHTGSSSRSAALSIAGQLVAISQDRFVTCTVGFSPLTAVYGKEGGSGSVTVTAPAGCAWTVRSTEPWLVITSGAGEGAGTAIVNYSVAANTVTSSRTGAIAVVDRIFVVTQAGDTAACSYGVSPVEFSPCMTSPQMTAVVTTQSGCTWTSSATDPWIQIVSGQSGSGSGTIVFGVTDNWLAVRAGQILVRWPTVTAGQNMRIAQAGCRYSVNPASIAVVGTAGTASFDVYQQSDPYTCGGPLQNGCLWSAESADKWITVTSSMPRAGDDRVTISIADNPGAPRTGTITVRDQIVRITQAAK